MAQQSITLQTSDADVVSGDVLGRVNFAASNESSGSEAKWIGASVFAEASGEFTATVNPTNLVFATSDADGVTARYKVTNVGHLIPNVTSTYNIGSSALKINNIFSATGTLDRVATTGIQLTGSASQSGLLYINNSNLISSSPNVLFSNSDLASPKLIFKASGTTTPDLSLNILTTASGTTSGVQTLSIQGSAGELFSITDVLDSGTIFSVNDISGLSLIEADASGVVTLVRYGTNVAVGDFVPTQKLHVGGNLRVSGAYYDSLNSPGTSGQVLVSTAVGTDWKTLSEIVGVDGVGISGYTARWIDAETISSGIIYDNGTNIGIGTASPSQKLHVNGNILLDQSIFTTQSNAQFLTTGGFALPIKIGSLTISSTYAGVDAPLSGLYVQGNAGIGTTSPTAKLHIQTGAATTTGVIVRGAASQTADLFQAQNSAGTALVRVDAAGSISGVASGIFMGRVGIGITNPAFGLESSGNAAIRDTLYVGPPTSQIGIIGLDTSSRGQMGANAQTIEPNNGASNLRILTPLTGGAGTISIGYWKAGLAQQWNRALSISNSPTVPHLMLQPDVGGTMIGTSTDINARLGVRGSGDSLSLTDVFKVQNADGSGIFTIRDNGTTVYGPTTGLNGATISSSDGSDNVSFSAMCGLRFRSSLGATTNGADHFFRNYQGSRTYTAGAGRLMEINGAFAPVGGTSTYETLNVVGTINQTGGANGAVRGIYVNQTLTSVSDYRAIEANNNTGWAFFAQGTASSHFNGNVGIGTTSVAAGPRLFVVNSSAAVTGVIVRGAASQTADFLQIQNSAGTTLLDIDAAGSLSGVGSGIFMQRVGIANASPQNLLTIGSGIGTGLNVNSTAGYGLGIHHSGIIVISPETAGNNAVHNLINLTVSKPAADWGGQATIDFNVRDRGNNYPSRTSARITAGDANGDVGRGIISFATALNSGTAPATAMTIINNGNVGIGTINPAELFTVYGSNQNIQLQSATNAGSNAIIFADTAARFEIYRPASSSDLRFKSRDGGVGDVMTLTYSTANVGIGTTSPTQRLHVSGNMRLAGAFFDSLNVPGTSGQVLVSTSGGVEWRTSSGGIDGTGSANYLARWIDADTLGTGIVYDNGTNVGIGTAVPSGKLHVANGFFGTTPVSTANLAIFESSGDNGITIGSKSDGLSRLVFGHGTFNNLQYIESKGTSWYINYNAFNNHQFAINGSEKVRIDASGNIGIGTTAPSGKLHIETGAAATTGIIVRGATSQTADFQQWQNSAGTMLASVTKDGNISYNTSSSLGLVWGTASLLFNGQNEGVQIRPYTGSYVGFSVKGQTAQSYDLTQWKDSTGTVLARVDAAGSISGVASGIFMGRVGIGTSNPTTPLEVNGTVTVNSYTTGYYEGYRAIWLQSTHRNIAGTAFQIANITNQGLTFGSAASQHMVLTSGDGNLGIGTLSPTQKLDVRGSAFISGALYDSNNSAGTNGQVLTSTVTGTDWKSLSEIVGVDGVGTSGYIARWIDGDTIGTGVIYDNGTNVGVRTTAPSTTLDVRGTGYFSESVRTSGTVVFASGNTGTVGVMQWNDGEGTVQLGLKGGNVNVELAQDNVVLCYNGVGSSLSKGQVVYASGAQGQRPSVNLALATSDLSSARTIGLVDETIGVGAEGFVATFGVVTNLNTSALTAGSGLWLSATTPGAITMTRPVAPNHGVFLGWCLNSHVSAGRIFVNVQNGAEIEELHDVLIQNVASGDVLQYDSSNLTWRNRTRSQAGLVEGVGTSGYVSRWISANVIGTGVVYDNGTNVGIGTTSPTAKLQVNHSSVSGLAIIGSHDRNLYIQNDGSSTGILLQHQGQNRFEVFTTGTVFINKSSTNALKSLAFYDPASNLYEYNGFGSTSGAVSALRYNVVNSNFDHIFFRGDSGAASTELMRIRGNRTVGINTAAPAAMLHVTPTGTTATGIIVRGVASQTADLQQWQNSAGTALVRVDAAGSISGVASGIFMQRIGVATSDPTQTLHVAGNARLTGALFDSLNLPGTSGQFLVSTSGGIEWRTGGGGGVTGTGAANKLAFFDSTTNITSDTNLHWDNTNKRLGVGQVSPVTVLDVLRSGIITTSQTGVRIINNSTSSTNSISKEGLFVASSGTFSGSSTTNRGLSVRSYNGATVEGINILAQTAASTLYGIQSVLTINSTETNIYGYHTTASNSINTQNKTYYGYNFQLSDDETTATTVNSYGVRSYQDFTDNTSAGSKYGIYSYIKNASNSNSAVYGLYSDVNLPASPINNSYGCFIIGGGAGGRLSYGVYTTGTNNNYFDSRVGINQISPTAMLQVQPTGATVTGVIVRGAGGQTADLLQIQTSVSNPIFKVASNGSVLVDLSPAAVTTATGIIVRGAANQTADLQQWQNSLGTALVRVDAVGSISGVASGIFDQNLRVANIPSGTTETDVVLVKTDGTFVKRPSSSLGVGGGSGISNEDSIINALIFG